MLKAKIGSRPMQNKSYKVYVVGGQINYANWLPRTEVTDNFKSADVVMFTGGEDVSPSLYGERPHRQTFSNYSRDMLEQEYFNKAVADKKKIIGICRGSQFSCVMSGGKLVQHQMNNNYIHPISTTLGDILITSTHHQAMYPFNLSSRDYRILGSTKDESIYHKDGNNKEMNPPLECEIVFFNKTQALGIQGHPEHLWEQREFYLRTFEVLNKYYLNLMEDVYVNQSYMPVMPMVEDDEIFEEEEMEVEEGDEF